MPVEKKARLWERDPLDFYVEEPRASAALFRAERFVGKTLDPACGSGNIVESARAAGVESFGSDVVDRCGDALWFVRGLNGRCVDFLADTPDRRFMPWAVTNIVCNPPFFRGRGTEAFIRRALDVARGKVAIFAPLPFLAGDRRRKGLFAERPPHRVYVLAPRVSCPPGEWVAAAGRGWSGRRASRSPERT